MFLMAVQQRQSKQFLELVALPPFGNSSQAAISLDLLEGNDTEDVSISLFCKWAC